MGQGPTWTRPAALQTRARHVPHAVLKISYCTNTLKNLANVHQTGDGEAVTMQRAPPGRGMRDRVAGAPEALP